MRADEIAGVGPIPRHYEPLPGHPPLFATRRSSEPELLKHRIGGLVVGLVLIVPVTLSMFIGTWRTVASGGLSAFNVILVLLLVVTPVALFIRGIWGTLGAGIVVDARGIHRAHGVRSAGLSIFIDELVDVEPIRTLTAAHRNGVQSPRWFLGNERTGNVYLTVDAPMGKGRAIIGVRDMDQFLTALDTARRVPQPTAWQPVDALTAPAVTPDRLDVDIRTEDGELSLRGRGFSFSRRRNAALDGIAEVRVTRDTFLRRELRARRGYNIGQWFAAASMRVFSHPSIGWNLRWVGKNLGDGAVILVLEEGGVIVVSTDHPEHVALEIQALRRERTSWPSRATASTDA